jgi:DNA-binding response OmpR family regulator
MARILVIEDDQILGAEIKEALEDAGYQVDWVTTGVDGNAKVEKEEYDLLFLDIMLSDSISGFDVLKHIRVTLNNHSLMIVMLTNLGESEQIERAMNIGANDYLIKANIDLDNLVELTSNKFLSDLNDVE